MSIQCQQCTCPFSYSGLVPVYLHTWIFTWLPDCMTGVWNHRLWKLLLKSVIVNVVFLLIYKTGKLFSITLSTFLPETYRWMLRSFTSFWKALLNRLEVQSGKKRFQQCNFMNTLCYIQIERYYVIFIWKKKIYI